MSKTENPITTKQDAALTRRQAGSLALIGALAASTAGFPMVANATPQEADPIYAAIERHKAASLAYMRAVSVAFDMSYKDPRHAAASAAEDECSDKANDAAIDLVDTPPTTFAGVMALMRYVSDFDGGMLFVSATNYSSHEMWPDELQSDDVTWQSGRHKGKPVALSFHAWILRTVALALENIGGAA